MNENQFNIFMRVAESIDTRLGDIYEIISKTKDSQARERQEVRKKMIEDFLAAARELDREKNNQIPFYLRSINYIGLKGH